VVYIDKVLMVVQRFVSQVIVSIIDLQILLQDRHYLLQDGDFLVNIYYSKNLIHCFLAIELPVTQPEKDDHINIQSMIIELELPLQR